MRDEERLPLVLVIDDSADTIDLYQHVLPLHGWRMLGASSGREGLHLAVEYLPAAVVVDVSMPDLDGYSVTRWLKAEPATAGIPVIVMSAHAHQAARDRAREAGADGYVTKPCAPDALLAEIRRCARPSS